MGKSTNRPSTGSWLGLWCWVQGLSPWQSCLSAVLSAHQRNMMSLFPYFPSNFLYIFIFPDLLSTGKLSRPSSPILSSSGFCGHLIHSYISGFPAPTGTTFLPNIFSLLFWHLPPVLVWSCQQSFLLTLPVKEMHLCPCSLLPPATVSSGHPSQAQVLSCSLSLFHLQRSNLKNSDFPAHITWISLSLLLRAFTFFRSEIHTSLSWIHFLHLSFLPAWPASEAWNTCQQLNHDSVSQWPLLTYIPSQSKEFRIQA